MSTLVFDRVVVQRPDAAALQATLAEAATAVSGSTDGDGAAAALASWEQAGRTYETQRSIASIRFAQDTRAEAHRADKQYFDDLDPSVTGWNLDVLRALVGSTHREALEARYGAQAFRLWESSLRSFDPTIADHKRKESELSNRYDDLRSTITVPYAGQSWTLSTIRGFYGDPDRAVRLAVRQAEDAALAAHQGAFDQLYDELVHVRDDMARALGYPSYTPLGYAEMRRTDWDADDAAKFRDAIASDVVPLASRIHARRGKALGITDPGLHDEAVADPRGAVHPLGDAAWLEGVAADVYDQLVPELGAFYRGLRDRRVLDLLPREGKVGGGFCDGLADLATPFILANFVGNQDDVEVLVHETGHAFQWHRASRLPLRDLHFPTFEAAEIHSMGLEFLVHPEAERFFGPEAERWRREHLEDAVIFFGYGAAVDAFQHAVYDAPGQSPDDRAAAWRGLEATFLPHRRYPSMPYFAGGRFWQRQSHIYARPFYYLDYALAQTCALQLWSLARRDRKDALARYVRLCDLGGSRSFRGLLDAVGLADPFQPGVLTRVCDEVAGAIGL